MSNRNINQSGIPFPPLAMRAKAPVFSTEGGLYVDRVGGNYEQSTYPTYPTYPTTFKAEERGFHPIESPALSQPVAMPGTDRLMNARQVAAKLGVSERWVRDHTTRRSPRIRGLKMGSLMRYRLADVEAFLAELDTQPSSRPSRFRV
jgi:predicted DNA-binding transcriptional regulator AlpA